jgi:uncharacterized membrane protein HdeD (DUF308 family)
MVLPSLSDATEDSAMSSTSTIHPAEATSSSSPVTPRRIVVIRGLLALAWAGGLVIALGHRVPLTNADLPFGAAALLVTYPAIDALASFRESLFATSASARMMLRVNAVISATAIIALAVTAFGSDAGSTLAAFGAWAALSGAIQFTTAIRRNRAGSRQLTMIISGGLSTIAGLSFIAASNSHSAHLANLAGYMALGAVLYFLSLRRSQAITSARAR